jgi:hypothetical protein
VIKLCRTDGLRDAWTSRYGYLPHLTRGGSGASGVLATMKEKQIAQMPLRGRLW